MGSSTELTTGTVPSRGLGGSGVFLAQGNPFSRINQSSFPDAVNAIRIELSIPAEHGEIIGHRLRDDDTVKWIAVMERQKRHGLHVSEFQRQHVEPVSVQ